ncbi:hypothetical protein K438DRAFT_1782621 [Mycena galopus ATCC 62051]|nr:hypothetical protein K438DRAFT_1782621 [Mycena galopus ATCC 62051]
MARVRFPLIPPAHLFAARFPTSPSILLTSFSSLSASPHLLVYRTYPARLGFQHASLCRDSRPLPRLLLPPRGNDRRGAFSGVLHRLYQWDGGGMLVRVYARAGLRQVMGGVAGIGKLIVPGEGRVYSNDKGAVASRKYYSSSLGLSKTNARQTLPGSWRSGLRTRKPKPAHAKPKRTLQAKRNMLDSRRAPRRQTH